ncbi:MAG: hypothetical protein V3T61_04215 [Acidobacteriota bacterium]
MRGIRAVAVFGVEGKAQFSSFGASTRPMREHDCWKAVRLALEERLGVKQTDQFLE